METPAQFALFFMFSAIAILLPLSIDKLMDLLSGRIHIRKLKPNAKMVHLKIVQAQKALELSVSTEAEALPPPKVPLALRPVKSPKPERPAERPNPVARRNPTYY